MFIIFCSPLFSLFQMASMGPFLILTLALAVGSVSLTTAGESQLVQLDAIDAIGAIGALSRHYLSIFPIFKSIYPSLAAPCKWNFLTAGAFTILFSPFREKPADDLGSLQGLTCCDSK